MFSIRIFVKSGLLKAIGNMADYQIILNAAGWLEKGVLEESDLAEIQAAIEANEIAKSEASENVNVIEDQVSESENIEPAE